MLCVAWGGRTHRVPDVKTERERASGHVTDADDASLQKDSSDIHTAVLSV